jgi:hypothetical protein
MQLVRPYGFKNTRELTQTETLEKSLGFQELGGTPILNIIETRIRWKLLYL